MMKKNKNSSKVIFSIVGFLDRFPKRCFNYKQICKQLGVVDASGKNHVIKTLKKLNERKIINEVRKGYFQSISSKSINKGIFIIHRGKTSIILGEDEKEIVVSSTQRHKAFSGDLVSYYTYPSRGRRKEEAKIIEIIERIIRDNSKQHEQYLNGKEKLFGFFVGQVMKETKGSADPKEVNKLLVQILKQ